MPRRRILLVSRSWPPQERSGVSLAAVEHARMLLGMGHDVGIVGAHAAVQDVDLPVACRLHVPAAGSGSLYAPARVDAGAVDQVLAQTSPDLVVTEAWQTALTDGFVERAGTRGIPVLMISHGISLAPVDAGVVSVLKSMAWWPYRHRRLPRLMQQVSVLTTLDEQSSSPRFMDRDLARRLGKPVLPLGNSPVNWDDSVPGLERRDDVVLVVGYYSAVKNQLGALALAERLRERGWTFRFVGPRQGPYYERCHSRVQASGLGPMVEFLEDHECDLAREVGRCRVLLSTSTTEGLPITLVEAMASGTPYVATPVGAVPGLRGGIACTRPDDQERALVGLMTDPAAWRRCAQEGRQAYEARFSRTRVREQLTAAVELAVATGTARVS